MVTNSWKTSRNSSKVSQGEQATALKALGFDDVARPLAAKGEHAIDANSVLFQPDEGRVT